jgi:hypothetical protein
LRNATSEIPNPLESVRIGTVQTSSYISSRVCIVGIFLRLQQSTETFVDRFSTAQIM